MPVYKVVAEIYVEADTLYTANARVESRIITLYWINGSDRIRLVTERKSSTDVDDYDTA